MHSDKVKKVWQYITFNNKNNRNEAGDKGSTEKKYEKDMENVYVRDIMEWHGEQN